MTGLADIFRDAKTIAIVGLSDDETRASYDVAKYLRAKGFEIIPVNPQLSEVFGVTSYPDLHAIPVPVDVVDVFRRSEHLVPIARAAVDIGAKVLWMQDGVINEEAAKLARDAGLTVVMNDCMHRQHFKLTREGAL